MFLSNKDTVQILVANREVASSQEHSAGLLSHSIGAPTDTVSHPRCSSLQKQEVSSTEVESCALEDST